MKAILYMKDGRIVTITSDTGKYSKSTYDCWFESNVRAIDGETIMTLCGCGETAPDATTHCCAHRRSATRLYPDRRMAPDPPRSAALHPRPALE